MRASHLAVLSVLVFGTLNCGSRYSDNYTLYILPGFSQVEEDEIYSEAHAWEKAVNIKVTILHAPDTSYCDQDCYSILPATRGEIFAAEGTNYIGFTVRNGDCDCGRIVLLDNGFVSDLERRTTIAHEMGHAWGLEHVPAHHLMYWNWDANQPSAITCGDQRQYAELRGGTYTCLGDVSLE